MLSDSDKIIINNFVGKIDISNVINIYKEYEFVYEEDNSVYHGIIDLMLEYDNDIKIIDYKLKNISDSEYVKQLNGYRKYIENIFNKNVSIYLYSILDDDLEELQINE